jgi:hypothetical protein
MRFFSFFVLAGLLMSPALAAETEVVPKSNPIPTLTVEQPTNPTASKPGGPVIVSLTARLGLQLGNATNQIIPDFHFIAPNGNAVLLHREVVETNANNIHINPAAPINIPADAQKQGAVISGGWTCNLGQYYVKMRAYIMDADGNRSNEIHYTVHCNGG